MRRIRVCRICEQFPPFQGGLSSGMLDLSIAQYERGHEITIITRSVPGDKEKEANVPFEVIRIPCRGTMTFGLKAYRTVERMQIRPDVIHTHGPSAFYYLFNRKRADPPLVHTLHAVRKYQYSLFNDLASLVKDFERILGSRVTNKPRFYKPFSFYVLKEIFIERYISRNADHILVVADYFARQIKDYYGISPKKISVSFNGSNFNPQDILSADVSALNNMEIDCNRDIILYVGRTDWVKRVHLLVESMPLVLNRFPDACLVIAGKGDQSQDLERLAKKLNLSDSVKLVGWIPHYRISALLKIAKCFCLPSYWEGLSKSLLEAMSVKLPIVAANNLSNREVLQGGDYGWLINEPNPEAWCRGILNVLSNSQAVHNKVDLASDLLDKKFRWNQVAERVEKAYEKILN